MKVNLQQSYFWNRRTYGPGEVEIPDDLAIALGLHQPDEPTAIELPDKSATAAETGSEDPTVPFDPPPPPSKPTTKRKR